MFTSLLYNASTSAFQVKVDPQLTGSALNLTLLIEGTPFALNGADSKTDITSGSTRTWTDPGFSWSRGAIRITERVDPPGAEHRGG